LPHRNHNVPEPFQQLLVLPSILWLKLCLETVDTMTVHYQM